MTRAASALEPSTVAELMTEDPLTLEPEDTLETARGLMISCRIRHLPVIRAGRLCGMVSARDLAAASRLHDTRAREVMHAPVETLGPDDSIRAAADRLLAFRFSSLPVLQRGQVVGIITSTDLVRAACGRLDGERVSQLMTPAPLVTVDPHQSLEAACELMREERIRHLPVVEGEELIGFVSDLDLLAAAGETVLDAMIAPSRYLAADARAVDAGHVMIRDRLDALPVVQAGRLVGVLSAFDFLFYLLG